ncbi:MAG: glycosyltransferase family 4 protein [Gemmatimonadota bacterium]
MPSVAYLLSDLGGGTGHHLFSVLRERPGSAWTARILSEVGNTARGDCPVPLELLAAGRFTRYPISQGERFLRLRRKFAEEPADILHTFFFWSIIYGRLLKASGTVNRLVENREDMGFNWGRHEYTLLHLTKRIPDRIVCVSEAVRTRVLEKERIDPARVRVIRNGVAAPPASDAADRTAVRVEFGIPDSSPIVGMVANFNRLVKGAVHFVDALPMVAREIPDVRFLLIGLGENETELRQRAESAGVGGQLLFPGFRSDIDRFYGAMDVSALTSLSEGLSITLLESMRHGIPVVATSVGGNPEVVRHGETGFLVPPTDPELFAAKVVRLLKDAGLRARFSRKAREVVRESFHLPDVAAAYGSLYRELADSEPREASAAHSCAI